MKDKKAKKPKSNKEKALKKVSKSNNEKIGTKFINIIKKRWLISGTNTMLLIAILIAMVTLLNVFVQSLKLTPIDCTSNKQFTLTKESKERTANITDTINIYLAGYQDSDTTFSLVKQYNNANSNINVEVVDVNERADMASKYSIVSGSKAIIVENGEKSKVISSEELYTYDSDYNTIDITEEKVTSAILNVTTEKIPTVYFLSGYSEFNIETSDGKMKYILTYLDNEILNYKTLNMLTSGSIPEDCDTLIITTPTKDFDELTTTEIINYINKGGNILWLNSCYTKKMELINVNKILEVYGINPFEVGYIYETDDDRIALGYSSCILEDLGNTKIDKNLNNILLLNSTKINTNPEKFEELKVTEQVIIKSTDKSYYRENVSNTSMSIDTDENGPFTIGGIYTKTLSENSDEQEDAKLTSKLVIYGNNEFISDMQVAPQVGPMFILADNKDVMLNSIAYLTEQDSDITIRKNYTKKSNFTATDGQKSVIVKIIFIIPLGIMIFGLIIWQIRRRKK